VRKAILMPLSLSFGFLLGCGGPHEEPAPFVREPLLEHQPVVVATAGEGVSWRSDPEPRGQIEVRPSKRGRKRGRQLSSPEIDVIRQRPGSVLRWDVDLGADPYLELVPLDCLPEPCPDLRYRVSVEDGAGRHRVVQAPPGQTVTSPTTVQASLHPWAGRRVGLLFELATRGGSSVPWGRWGDPSVYSRRPRAEPSPPPEHLNVVLFGLDTLRADALGAYGRTPSPTPGLDRIAREGELWENAFSTINNTNPSFASIHTGLYPKNHGIYDLSTPLPVEIVTLAERFSDAGYQTLAVLGTRHLGDRTSGLGQGFDLMTMPRRARAAAEQVVNRSARWIANHRDRPFFAWLHLFDAHTPHVPPTPWAAGLGLTGAHRLEPLTGWIWMRERPGIPHHHAVPVLAGEPELYLSEVGYMDHQIDRFLGMLDGMGLLDRTVVAVVGDHGENLGEHGLVATHEGLFDTTTHVPLIIRWPDGTNAGSRHSELVQTLDLFPTLLEATGLEAPPSDAVGLAALSAHGGRRAVFSEHAMGYGASIRTRTHRLTVTAEGVPHLRPGSQLYDVRTDAGEESDLAVTNGRVRARLERVLETWIRKRGRAADPDAVDLSEAERAELEALGYVQ
jgi:arylsulfatase A-like enzyme